MQLRLNDLSDAEFGMIHDAVLRYLSEYGMIFEHDEANRILSAAGNELDSDGRIHLSPAFVERCLEQVPREGFVLYGRDEEQTCRVAVDSFASRPSTGLPYIMDYATGERRDATMDDARTMVLLTDALEHFDLVNSVVSPADAPGQRATVGRFINAHRHSLKPSDITVASGREVEAIARVAAAIRGSENALRDRPLTAVDVAVTSPLRCTPEDTEALLACARGGLPIEILTCPALGLTSPLTLAGGAAVTLAEMIGALCLVYQVAPGLGIINTSRVQPVNMRSGALNYGAPEFGMASVIVADCSARYGLPTNLYGLGTVAQTAGLQAAMEKSLGGLLLSLGRVHMVTGPGILDNAMVTSPELLVVDHELIRFLKQIRRDIPFDQDAIGVDMAMRGFRERGALLGEKHTVEYLRAGELVAAGLDQWLSQEQWEGEGRPDMLRTAHDRVQEILGSHTVPGFDPALERELDRIVEEF